LINSYGGAYAGAYSIELIERDGQLVVYYGTWGGCITEALATEDRTLRSWKANEISESDEAKVSYLKVLDDGRVYAVN
jgi:hypothetical protein